MPSRGIRSRRAPLHPTVTALTLDRSAVTTAALAPELASRWSPRAFDPAHTVSDEQVTTLLEAARWSPSANNYQPWRFAVARRDSALWAGILATLTEWNQQWARTASALIVNIAEVTNAEGDPRPTAHYDLGQAVAALTVQAQHDGLLAHQMTGFRSDAAAELLHLPTHLVPFSVTAIGIAGSPDVLPEAIAAREGAPRVRRPLSETLIASA